MVSPDFISLAVTYHDVKGSDEVGGHPDFEHINQGEPGLVGDVCTPTNHGLTTNTCGTLNAQGKPQLLKANPATIQSAASFASWYLSDPTINKTIPGSLTLARQGVTGSTYAFDSSAFFPLDGNPLGFGEYHTTGHDFGFTTEIDYFFQYGGGETLTFRGDDDVWGYVSRKLAVDIGGVHGSEWGRVILGDEASRCSAGGVGSLARLYSDHAKHQRGLALRLGQRRDLSDLVVPRGAPHHSIQLPPDAVELLAAALAMHPAMRRRHRRDR